VGVCLRKWKTEGRGLPKFRRPPPYPELLGEGWGVMRPGFLMGFCLQSLCMMRIALIEREHWG